MADLDGAEAAVAFGSGMGAIAAALSTLPERPRRKRGGRARLVVSQGIYGGSTEFLREHGERLGLDVIEAPAWDTAAFLRADDGTARALYVEVLSNPLLRVADLGALARHARAAGIPLVVDSTFTPPCLCRPTEHGAALVIHSVSKYIGGHGDVIGGVVAGSRAALAPLRRHRTLAGAIMDPFTAWLALRGLRTLAVRLERQCETAARVAGALALMPEVRAVHYPGRADHPDRARAARYLARPGAMVSFELGGLRAARRFYDRVHVIARAASLGEVASLLTHPATFSHKGLTAAEQARAGITDGLLRLSVGLEDANDLVADIRQALG